MFENSAHNYYRIEKALLFLETNFNNQPTLSEMAASVHMSEFHFQKVFSNWVGISPKRFLQFLTKEHAKKLLQESASLLEVAFATGLSGSGRLHDLFVTFEAVSPGEYKKRGGELEIQYGFHPSPFGDCLLATTSRGICGLSFVQDNNRAAELANLRKKWEDAKFIENQSQARQLAERLFVTQTDEPRKPFHLYLKGTNFQMKVWEALLKIPHAKIVSYEDIAVLAGKPKAVRAVASAIGKNPAPFLIPCHRVIRKIGEWGEYGEGRSRKKAIIGWEAVQRERLQTSH